MLAIVAVIDYNIYMKGKQKIMSKTAKPIAYNDNDRAIVKALKGTDGMTIAEINKATGHTFVSGNIVSAMKKGLIEKTGEKEILRPTTRTVSTYIFVTKDIRKDENGKSFNYTENESKILEAAASIESPFTLAELATAMGLEKLSSGSINGLVKKGNFSKGEGKEIEAFAKSTVGVYSFVKDIPDAE